MFGAIKHNLANLFNFSGQDSRSTFWWYFLFLFILWIIAYVVMIVPVIAGAVGTAMDGAQSGVDQAAMEAEMQAQVLGSMGTLALNGLIITLVFTLLIAASLVRRARDAGKPGWWGAVPIVLNLVAAAIGYFVLQSILGQIGPEGLADPEALMNVDVPGAVAGDLLGWLAIILAIVIGVLPSAGAPANTHEESE